MSIKLKQIDLPPGFTTSAVADGALLTGTEAAELIAGVDGTNHAQFIATETNGNVRISDGGGSLTVDGTVAVSGTVPVSDGGASLTVDGAVSVSNFPATQAISAAALPLPTGAATEATLATRLAEATFTTRVPTVGTKTAAGSSPVVLASDQAALSVTDGGGSLTVDGAVSVSNFPATQAVSVAALPLPAGAATEATLATRLTEATFTTRVPTVGTKTAAGSSPVVLASDQPAINVIGVAPAGPATAAVSSVAASATSVTLVASNTARKGATVQNDSAAALYLKLGTAAAAASYTCLMAAGSYYETPYGYTGIITGAWVSAVGAALVTEVS